MNVGLLTRWQSFRESFWFLPLTATLFAIALSFVTTAIDDEVSWNPSTGSPFGYAGQPEGARSLLSVMAGSTITAAATAFSITIATLVLASSQFGPRLIRNFISDTGIQAVLGIFIGTFAYCLMVLRTIRGTEDAQFVPQISITVALALALISIIALIYFIHHVATSIQVNAIIRGVSGDLERSIDRLYKEPDPDEDGQEEATEEPDKNREEVDLNDDEAGEISCRDSGYVQAIDVPALMKLAEKRDVVIKLKYHAGRFVLQRSNVALVWPADAVDDELEAGIDSALKVGGVRTPEQDVEFAIDQLVEIAVRALSPGINDPFTALACIDYLGSALVRIVEREFPDPVHHDESGKLRVIAAYAGFGSVVDAAFNQIRQYGRANPAIVIRLLETIAIVARRTENEAQRDCLVDHADMLKRAADELVEANDRADARERFRDVLRALNRVREEEHEQNDTAEAQQAPA